MEQQDRSYLHHSDAVEWAKKGKKVILVREETNPEDIEGMRAAEAILTAQWRNDKPCCFSCKRLG